MHTEDVLQQIGVQHGVERDVFTQFLQRAAQQSETSAGGAQEKRSSFTTLARSIVENENVGGSSSDVIEFTDEMRKELQRQQSRKRKLRAVDDELIKQRYANDSSNATKEAASVSLLNNLVLDVAASSNARRKPKDGNNNLGWTSCPLCNRSLNGLSELAVSKHVDRCERRGLPSDPFAGSSSVVDLVDDDGTDNSDAEFPSTNQKKKQKKQQKQKAAQVAVEVPADDYDEDDIVGTMNERDDWEDADYLRRRHNLNPEDYDSLDIECGGVSLVVPSVGWGKLFDYQRTGVKWMSTLFRQGVGGILADEMGLGKTAQVCVHFGAIGKAAVQTQATAQSMFLVVCPATVLVHWMQEMHSWSPLLRVGILHPLSKTGKELCALTNDQLLKVFRTLRRSTLSEGVVVITSYDFMRKYQEALCTLEWTAVCLDEGQKIRNPLTAVAVACKQLPAFHRLLLSGTPIQNSLLELWSLIDFVYPGRLGTQQAFDEEFAYPIRAGAYAHASKLQYEVAIRCAAALQRMVRPYLLRRRKDDPNLVAAAQLPPKTEQILFCPISKLQRQLYTQILGSEEVEAVINRKLPAFRAISMLRKLCNHPVLVYREGAVVWSNEGRVRKHIYAHEHTSAHRRSGNPATVAEGQEDLDEEEEERIEAAAVRQMLQQTGSHSLRWEDSGKLLVLSKLLPIWHREGHKVLVFSQTTAMLDILEYMVRQMELRFLRLDGQTPVARRAQLVSQFNTDADMFLMLLTTRTGGVGISLTSANRVILFDPDWNPMVDMQARERAWRLGQRREVTIYRLLSKGTIEEKIYQRQIFKLLLSTRVLEDGSNSSNNATAAAMTAKKALFSRAQLQELFELEPALNITSGIGAASRVAQPMSMDANDDHDVDATAASAASGVVQQEVQQEADEAGYSFAPVTQERLREEGEVHEMMMDMDAQQPQTTSSTSAVKQNLEQLDQKHDRRLLRALFAGEALAAVYNHDDFDPTASRRTQQQQRREHARLAAVADRHAQRAVSTLQASAPSFIAPPAAASSDEQVMFGSHRMLLEQADMHNVGFDVPSADAGAAPSSEDVLGRFFMGARSSVDAYGSSSGSWFGGGEGTGLSSASLLADLRRQEQDVRTEASILARRPSAAAVAPVSSAGSGVSMSRNSSSNSVNIMPTSNETVPSVSNSESIIVKSEEDDAAAVVAVPVVQSLEDTLRSRLLRLFQTRGPTLATQDILTHFRDLGDQYAALFRRLLRQLATLHNGIWRLK